MTSNKFQLCLFHHWNFCSKPGWELAFEQDAHITILHLSLSETKKNLNTFAFFGRPRPRPVPLVAFYKHKTLKFNIKKSGFTV